MTGSSVPLSLLHFFIVAAQCANRRPPLYAPASPPPSSSHLTPHTTAAKCRVPLFEKLCFICDVWLSARLFACLPRKSPATLRKRCAKPHTPHTPRTPRTPHTRRLCPRPTLCVARKRKRRLQTKVEAGANPPPPCTVTCRPCAGLLPCRAQRSTRSRRA